MLIVIVVILWAAIGGFATGVARSINDPEAIDSFGMCLMVVFAPFTMMYVIGHITILLGMRFARFWLSNSKRF